jgi:lambda family phage tail tape measure protein
MLNRFHHEFVTNFAGGVGTTFKLFLEYLQDISKETNIVGETTKTVMQTIVVTVSDAVFVFQGLNRQLQMTMLLFQSFVPGSDVEGKWSKYIEEGERARQKLDEFQRRAMGGGGGYGGGASTFDDPRRLDRAKENTGPKREVKASPEAKRMQQMLDMAKLISKEYERHLEFNLSNLKTQGEMAFMTENQRKIQEAVNKVSDETDKKLGEIQKKREEAAAHGANQKVIDELDRQAEAVQRLGEKYQELTQVEMQSQIEAQSTFEYGWNKAFAQYAEDAGNAANMGQQYFQTMVGAMNNAIDTFVQTGKFSFKDFATSIIRDLIAIQMKMQAMQLFKMAMGGMGMTIPTTVPKADGGFVDSNTPYMVGERGPEMFIPQGSGTIIPTSRAMGGSQQPTQQNVYNGPYIASMSAIDTQSATQFLAKNKQTIWAVNQSAQRSLPVSK